jgi:hypothetical protein
MPGRCRRRPTARPNKAPAAQADQQGRSCPSAGQNCAGNTRPPPRTRMARKKTRDLNICLTKNETVYTNSGQGAVFRNHPTDRR